MPATWVSVTFINGPKNPGGKYGSIKTNELGYVSVPVEKLGDFDKGGRYCIEYTENGKYKNFARFANTPPAQAAQPHSQPAGRQQAQPQYPRQAQPQRPAAPPQPVSRPHYGAGATSPAVPVDTTAMNIFVTGIVGRALGSGHFTAADIKELTQEAKAAFLVHLSGVSTLSTPARQSRSPEPPPMDNGPVPSPEDYGQSGTFEDPPLDDEIPF